MRVGADTEKLRAFCGVLRRSAQEINDALRDTKRLSTDVAWEGHDADEFRRRLQTDLAPQARASMDLLRDHADTLLEEARSQDATSGDGITFGVHAKHNLEDPNYARGRERLLWFSWDRHPKHSSDHIPLFRDGVSPHDVSQGSLGNCYFAAAMASLATTPEGRKQIDNMIHENGDGTYTVTFGDGQSVIVDGDLYGRNDTAVYGKTGDDRWYALIEKAYAEKHGGYDALDGGGMADNVFKELGLQGSSKSMTELSDAQLSELLRDADTDGRPMTASAQLYADGTGPDSAIEGTTGRHAFSVSDVTPPDADGTVWVTLRNPWGRPGGLHADGVKMFDDGTFVVDLASFRKMFDKVRYVDE